MKEDCKLINNRIAIFCLYCKNKYVLDSDVFILDELKRIADRVIVIVNGEISNPEKIQTDFVTIVYRENKGYDAAAYREILLDNALGIEIKAKDELILCNNTFFGPFVPLNTIFEVMKDEDCDFWGLSSSEKNLVQHIQSYFLVFKKKVLMDESIFRYFDKYVANDMSYEDVCRTFENGLYAWLISQGFKYSAFVKNINCHNYRNCYGSLAIDNIPVLKRKSFSAEYYDQEQCMAALKYIAKTYKMDIGSIVEDIKNLYGLDISRDKISDIQLGEPYTDLKEMDWGIDRNAIINFINCHEKIYIYGAGGIANHIYNSFFYPPYTEKMAGFVVSQVAERDKCHGHPVYSYRELDNSEKAFILAVSRTNSMCLLPQFKPKEEVLYLWK